MESSEKLGIFHASPDRLMLVMEMEAGKPTHVTYLLLIL